MSSGSASPQREPAAPSARIEQLPAEIQRLVLQGIESPEFEFTRCCSLASSDRQSQADFARNVQGISNALPPAERVYVVGADQKERKFLQVLNERDFDPANLRQILEKYLEPIPLFEAYELGTDDGVKFAVVVLSSEQTRPIFVKVDLQGADGRQELLRRGDIWIKKNTRLERACRADLELMTESQIQIESERRAENRFGDMRAGIEASIRLQAYPERRIPSDDLVFGPDVEFKAYVEQILVNQDSIRFRMLLTTHRDILVERWHSIDGFNPRRLEVWDSARKVAAVLHRSGSSEDTTWALSEANAIVAVARN